MNKKKSIITQKIVCEGNLTVPDLTAQNQIHGGYEFQAITSPNPCKGGSSIDICQSCVVEAKEFVDENHK